MTKVVYNACFGGFNLSDAAIARYLELKRIKTYPLKSEYGFTIHYLTEGTDPERKAWHDLNIPRHDPCLVQVVEELGRAANGSHAHLAIVDVDVSQGYRIDEYDGMECVMTPSSYEWIKP